MRVFVLFVLGACNDPRPKPAPKPAPVPVQASPRPPVRVTARQSVTWGQVEASDGCFFFSGPEGTDDRLTGTASIERSGEHITLTIDRAVFEGVYRDGALDVMRVSSHQYEGAWLAFERMHGDYKDGHMIVRYRYNECELAGECPGRCTIAGEIIFAPE